MRRSRRRSTGSRPSWVRRVQRTSNAMDIPEGLFTRTPHEIAVGLKRAVRRSTRTMGTKYRSAMSMINWFINRGGKGLSTWRRTRLEQAKRELRKVFGRE